MLYSPLSKLASYQDYRLTELRTNIKEKLMSLLSVSVDYESSINSYQSPYYNDQFTHASIKQNIVKYMEELKATRHIMDYDLSSISGLPVDPSIINWIQCHKDMVIVDGGQILTINDPILEMEFLMKFGDYKNIDLEPKEDDGCITLNIAPTGYIEWINFNITIG